MKFSLFIMTVVMLFSCSTGTTQSIIDDTDYSSLWKEVEDNIRKQLPKSALLALDKIETIAKTNNNSSQLIKVAVFRARINNDFEEESFSKTILVFDSLIESSSFPVKNIYYSLTAELYDNYYNDNQWDIDDNVTQSIQSNDLTSWSRENFKNKSYDYYLKSLENDEALKNIDINAYEDILIEDSITRPLRPSLYDLLAFRAINFFSSSENLLLAESFTSPKVLLPFHDFMKLNINKELSDSDYLINALQLYQNLMISHKKDIPAFVHDDLLRLKFVYSYSSADDAAQLYLESLKALERKYSYDTICADVLFEIASFYNDKADSYNPELSSDYKDYLVKAVEYCNKAVSQYPLTNAGNKCKNLLTEIISPSISGCSYLSEIYPDEYFTFNIDYANCNHLYFKIVEVDYNKLLSGNSRFGNIFFNDEDLKYYLNSKEIRKWDIDVNNQGDFRKHSIEIASHPLKTGTYTVLVSDNEQFDINNNYVTYFVLQVTDINAIVSRTKDNSYEILTVDRNTGNIQKNCKINIYTLEYDKKNNSYEYSLLKSYTTDQSGKCFISSNMFEDKYDGDVVMEIDNGNKWFVGNSARLYYSKSYSSNRNNLSASLYTDRAIYRPGQTVFFKGIITSSSKGDKLQHIEKNYSTKVFLEDVNDNNVGEVSVKTNEFGSFAGSFVIPMDGLTGDYTLECECGGLTSINVEEYKRPTFEISFENLSPQAVMNSDARIKVKSLFYSGMPLVNATVKYTVRRSTSWGMRFFSDDESTTQISSGTLTTNEDGVTEIKFVAKCPETKNYFFKPIFNFIVNVDVTDVSGETISDEYVIGISEQSVIIYAAIDKQLNTLSDSIIIRAVNVNGDKIDATFNLTFNKLKEPPVIQRQRLWANPESYSFTSDEYKKYLPKDVYGEDAMSSWIVAQSFNFQTTGSFSLNDKSLTSGYYSLIVTTDDLSGKEVKETFYFYLFDGYKIKLAKSGLMLYSSTDVTQPGDIVNIYLASSSKKAVVRINITSAGRIIKDECKAISGLYLISIPVIEADRGGLSVKVFSSFDNRDYKIEKNISVPTNNKKLTIKLLTERTSLLPGGQEHWSLVVKDYKGNVVPAEVLATMYDASLDFFAVSNYTLPSWGQIVNNNSLSFTKDLIEAGYNSGLTYYRYPKANVYYYNYENINWFGLFNSRFLYGNKRITMAKSRSVEVHMDIVADNSNVTLSDEACEEKSTLSGNQNRTAEKTIRRDFRETAFFYPQLETSAKDGSVSFDFVVPESMTRWKFRALAHTEDLCSNMLENEIIAKKDLYISANYPKVLYHGDVINYSANIANTSSNALSGNADIKIFDEYENDITSKLVDIKTITFSIQPGKSSVVRWTIHIPDNVSIIKVRTSADTKYLADAEEHIIPILTTKVLMTETLPITVNKSGSSTFSFKSFNEKFDDKKNITKSFTIEYTSNPIWYAVQALPYMDKGNEELTDVVYSKLYSNLIAGYIIDNNPTIEEVYKKIKVTNPEEFVSELSKNQELKNILINETPWIADAANEQEQREKMIMLFDYNQMKYNKSQSFSTLRSRQMSNGAFPWIEGSKYESYYVTMYIVSGFAHLNDIGVINIKNDKDMMNMLRNAVSYLDSEVLDNYKYLKNKKLLNSYSITSDKIKYMYLRSSLKDIIDLQGDDIKEVYGYYADKIEQGWTGRPLGSQAMSAIVLHNCGRDGTVKTIIKSFDERALHSEELGMYWRDLQRGVLFDIFCCDPIETMTSMIECYSKLTSNQTAIGEMKRWLLNQKRTTLWDSNKGTTEAIYALLLGGTPNFIGNYKNDVLKVGNQIVSIENSVAGGVKQRWEAESVDKDFGKITINKTEAQTSWGAAYWQYVTDYENVKSVSAGLSVERRVLKSSYKDGKTEFTEVKSGEKISSTDKVVVRMIIKADRNMEYIHLKDILPACFIAEETISGYNYSGGLLYYLSIRDASMNFYIERMSKGSYMIDYKVNIQQSGSFTAGLSKIQCYYAPEFSGQSDGIKVVVE